MVLANMFRDNGIHTRDEQAKRARPMVPWVRCATVSP